MDSIDVALYISYALTILAGIAAIAFPLFNSFGDPKSLTKSAAGLGALLVVFGIGWALAGAEVTESYIEFGVDAGLSKFIGGLLTMMYILTGIAIVGIVYTEVSKIIK
ncbi:hypothetical protein [Reichenbachiella versicolor]|uniref:hypothetical protein n=1 Tax=Reichenbachiella versicolor TaxID=1821036 RepID=UPI000D6E2E4F|nr:hypothetical protein [Reichenbachiella versicolor]